MVQEGLKHEFNFGVTYPYCVKCGDQDARTECPVLLLQIPFMPPSSNNCYVTVWKKKMRILSKEARAFKQRVLTDVVPRYLADISKLPKDSVYHVHYRIFFEREDVLTKTWGAEKNGAKSQYKKMDLENRLKLLSDVVSDALGIDDSQFFSGHQEKRSCAEVGDIPQVHIYVRRRYLQEYGFA